MDIFQFRGYLVALVAKKIRLMDYFSSTQFFCNLLPVSFIFDYFNFEDERSFSETRMKREASPISPVIFHLKCYLNSLSVQQRVPPEVH